ncbi:hypothetical protein [Lysobacter gummosus]|uniref:hypothetical protein n=1 Tax=Lysobacter gummosus TaxID=262324 RepID=UPI00363BE779
MREEQLSRTSRTRSSAVTTSGAGTESSLQAGSTPLKFFNRANGRAPPGARPRDAQVRHTARASRTPCPLPSRSNAPVFRLL